MRIHWLIALIAASCVLNAQSTDPDTEFLLKHALADRDSFGLGSARAPTLEDIARNGNSDFTTAKSDDVWIYPEESSSASGNMHDRAEAYLSRVLADSDAALLGHVTQQVSLFNSTKHNIVTDLLFQVDEVLRSDRTAEIQIGGKLVVTREGGIMHADGHRIEVRVNQFPPFETGGRYVLFLHRDARTGSYRVLSSDAFKVSGTTIHPAQTTAWATRVRVQIC